MGEPVRLPRERCGHRSRKPRMATKDLIIYRQPCSGTQHLPNESQQSHRHRAVTGTVWVLKTGVVGTQISRSEPGSTGHEIAYGAVQKSFATLRQFPELRKFGLL
jgi:hypothetical protein